MGDSFYCENCLRDAALVTAMRKFDHDVVMIPLYLPLQADTSRPISSAPLFFGGINVYLQQKSALFRKTPRWFDRLLDSPKLLGWVARRASMTNAKELGESTISMLRGEEGRQIKELNRLIEWLRLPENKPDVVCLSNILLIGLAKRVKEMLDVPVVCLLQDEDGFLDGLGSPYADSAWAILSERARDIDAFLAVSKYYRGTMRQRLRLQREAVHVVYTGIPLGGYSVPEARPKVPTIGFLSRMCSDRGLDTLADAFVILKKNEKLKDARLRIAGGKSRDDESFIDQIRLRLTAAGVIGDVEFMEDFDHAARVAFLQSLSLLSVPEKQPVAYGLYVLEALAVGVPVVEPAIGVFPELLEMTGGGVLYEPNDAKSLASAMAQLLLDLDRMRQLGKQGRDAIVEHFNIDKTATQMLRIYQEIR